MRRPSQVVAEAADWLLRNHQRWETFVEDDKDVQGTAWEHMAYALGAQAVLRAGGNSHDQRLARSWRLMYDLWDTEARLWNEPGASGKRATIRAAFHTVCAYEEARVCVAQLGMTEAGGRRGHRRTGQRRPYGAAERGTGRRPAGAQGEHTGSIGDMCPAGEAVRGRAAAWAEGPAGWR